MKQSTATRVKTILSPGARSGTSTETILSKSTKRSRSHSPTSRYLTNVLEKLGDDENLVYLAARLKDFIHIAEARLGYLKQALNDQDAEKLASVAHDLTDYTGRFGAIRMMRLLIALQMLARRNLLEKARDVLQELEGEYERYKQGLVGVAG